MDNRCTVVVSSCDAYEDTWLPFFKMLSVHWANCPYPIVLNTESKSFSYEGLDIKTFQFYKENERVEWGRRLIRTLKALETEYVIFLLDDFFFTRNVEQRRIEKCMQWMDEDSEIAVFSFWCVKDSNIQDGRYPHFERRSQNGAYRLNCQAALWKREKLISYIRPHENPWQWEILGSKRSKRYKEKFYSAIENEPYVFEYDWFSGGGVHRGKWTEGVPELFEKHNIEMDFSIRGFVNQKDPYDCANSIYSLKQNFWCGLFTKRFWQEVKKRIVEYIVKIKSLL